VSSSFTFRPSADASGAYLVYRRGHEQDFGAGFIGRISALGSGWMARHRAYPTREAAARSLAAMGAWGGSMRRRASPVHSHAHGGR
jgi:hypothetical protein